MALTLKQQIKKFLWDNIHLSEYVDIDSLLLTKMEEDVWYEFEDMADRLTDQDVEEYVFEVFREWEKAGEKE